MKPIKIFHTGDGHFSRENQEPFFKSADFLLERAEKEEPDLIVIAGDLFDRAVNDTAGSGFPDLVSWMSQLMEIAPVVAVTGTPTHDIAGCYDVFNFVDTSLNFKLLEAGKPCFLENYGLSEISNDHTKLLILGLPEPSKEWFNRDKQLGKAEGDEQINQGMREMLLGMGALRKQYPDIPCLFVGHLEVRDTPTCTGHIIQGGIKIGKDDLALVGADYYALGHIHLAQQIGNLPAWYCGSMYPNNFGETDQKGFNVVTLIRESADVRPQFFPHLPRKKIILEKPWTLECYQLTGFDVWIQAKATKEERHLIDMDYINRALDECDAGPLSKVEIVTIPTETVRSEQISEAVGLVDKLKVYAEMSNEKLIDSTIEKAESLEAQAKESGEVGEGLHIRIQKLILRGAIGIEKGLGLDEVTIDFDDYDPGLIALVGVNGAGKSTLIENMHPYPQLLTRSGILQNHFCLRDSFRDLYFIDKRTGIKYRALMNIDGQNKSGSVEYFLYWWDIQFDEPTWCPATIEINGRKDPYVEEITRLFGSIELFLRSAFVSQKQPKNLPDLSDATKGEKKALFRELGGLDYLQTYADCAKDNAKCVEDELTGMRAKLERREEVISAAEDANLRINVLSGEWGHTSAQLQTIKKKGESLKADHDRLKVIIDKNVKLRTEYEGTLKQSRGVDYDMVSLQTSLAEYQSALKGKEATEKLIKEYEDLKVEEAKLNEEKSKYEGARARGLARYNEEREAIEKRERELRDKKSEAEKAAQEVERGRDINLADANSINRDILENPLSENCPTCGQEWPPDKLEEYKYKRDQKQKHLEALQGQVFELDKDLVEKKKAVEAIQVEINALEWPEKPEGEEYDDGKLTGTRVQMKLLDIEKLKSDLSRTQEAEVRIQEGEKQLKALETTLNTLNERAADLQHQVDEDSEAEYTDVSKQLEECRAQYAETDKELTRLNTEIEGLWKQIEDKEAELAALGKLDEERKSKETDLTEWQYLQRACGPDGIQALELDAMGPGIAEVANSILESAYGARFQIEFRTTRIGGSGSKTKQIEDFQIVVHDSQSGDEQLLETLSGGESVWVKRAIYDAFGIIRARKTGTQFLTVYQDEADGALDPEARSAYFRMLEKAHHEAGRYHTIIITHSLEAQEMIGQKIEMSKLREVSREGVAV